MTDRLRTVTVVLDQDYRDDDAEPILNALRMVKGVSAVHPRVVDSAEHSARMAVTAELRRKVHESIREVFKE